MRIFHIDLKPKDGQHIALRYGWENLSEFQERVLSVSEISDLIARAERDYYVQLLPEDYGVTGQRLYQWLDGSDRWLAGQLENVRELTVLAIAAAGQLAHLPWEVLHDGREFLVEKLAPAIVPVRWAGLGTQPLRMAAAEPANRALNLLFMATSPAGVEPVLDFEAEEGRILTATRQQPLALMVEESGCLDELGNLVDSYDSGWFDVLHLTGHADHTDDGPIFITETVLGQRQDATAQDIAKAVQFRFPSLVFLSGCRTGQRGREGTLPSMAAQLLSHGAGAVLGWGQPVLDTDGITAAETLYGALAAAKSLPEALALTYQAMLVAKARDWHLLRLYVAEAIPGALVTPLRTKGRKKAPKPSVVSVFLDEDGVGREVAGRESFVGRRKELQACLRALMPYSDEETLGVLLHGLRGNGKSTLALRLCDRLTDYQKVVWIGPVDENGLVNKLSDHVGSEDLRQRLRSDEPLKYRLEAVFGQMEMPLLLVLDDFEQNLEMTDQRLKPGLAALLNAVLWAIGQTESDHRLLITCRYEFEFSGLSQLYRQPLATFKGANLEKKCSRLAAFQAKSGVEAELQTKAKELSDGNPRLLEWLSKVLVDCGTDAEAILAAMEEKTEEFRENILAETLLGQQSEEMREFLRRGLVYKLPVPRAAMVALGDDDTERHIERAVALGLMERTTEDALRVPRVLPLEVLETQELGELAARELYQCWFGNKGIGIPEVKFLEVHRLATLGNQTDIAKSFTRILANTWNTRGHFKDVISLCQEALGKISDHRIYMELAMAQSKVGDLKNSIESYDRAMRICPEDDRSSKAEISHHISIFLNTQGDLPGAIIHNKRSLDFLETHENAQAKGAVLCHKARLNLECGKLELAKSLSTESLTIFRKISSSPGEVEALLILGDIFQRQENNEIARVKFLEAYELARQNNFSKGIADSLTRMADLEVDNGNIEIAIAMFQKVLKFKETSENLRNKAIVLDRLAQLIGFYQQDFPTACKYFKESIEILSQIGSPIAKQVQQNLERLILQQF